MHATDRHAARIVERLHTSESCGAAEQCANCLGPHTAELANCPARPRKCAVFTIAFQGNNGGSSDTWALSSSNSTRRYSSDSNRRRHPTNTPQPNQPQNNNRNRTSHRTTACSGGSHGIASESRQPLGLHLASSTNDVPDATQDPETGT
ncbi:hypothetical protein MGU_11756 [Metarhizium guizhouense ARSEF 977]|uniref:Uncharacterized protein n=1 Tax=Metarhizium guizhouense (strain ARSEF 977) TaxID=1276136 RepID=A0A0B4G2L6_METGA|nr:hypothetical protein MGU_11756 [Metarhizium guizhouense ARSEF 977]